MTPGITVAHRAAYTLAMVRLLFERPESRDRHRMLCLLQDAINRGGAT